MNMTIINYSGLTAGQTQQLQPQVKAFNTEVETLNSTGKEFIGEVSRLESKYNIILSKVNFVMSKFSTKYPSLLGDVNFKIIQSMANRNKEMGDGLAKTLEEYTNITSAPDYMKPYVNPEEMKKFIECKKKTAEAYRKHSNAILAGKEKYKQVIDNADSDLSDSIAPFKRDILFTIDKLTFEALDGIDQIELAKIDNQFRGKDRESRMKKYEDKLEALKVKYLKKHIEGKLEIEDIITKVPLV